MSEPANPAVPPPAARSKVEEVKEASRALRGSIAEELAGPGDHFTEGNKDLIKFHGSYQQENRDARKARRGDGLGKHFMFMVRCKIPGGRMTAEQYLGLDALADKHANGTLRITSRQGIQFHGVLKGDLKATIAGINATLLTTLGACGDVERNVMASPVPLRDGIHEELQAAAALLADHFAPRTRAYHEIWLNGDKLPGPAETEEPDPIYGKVYLPRKFKTGLALPDDNSVDVYAQDLGLLAIIEAGRIAGYNVLVGGGMGMTHGNERTFPFLAQPICSIAASELVHMAESVIRLFRDHGNRADRKRARLKYVVHDWGIERFREVLTQYVGKPLVPPRDIEVTGFGLYHGWHPQGDGKWWYGLSIENGRIKDEGAFRLRTCLRELIGRHRPEVRLTPVQDILLCDLDGSASGDIERTLAAHGVRRPDETSKVRRYSLACPAIPTCGLAISESERALPGILDRLERELKELGLDDEDLAVRMTGCPNGCVRPYQSDIGIVGRSGDKYTLFVGGNVYGNRLNSELLDLVPRGALVANLRPLLQHFKADRRPAEGFGDWCRRTGVETLRTFLPATGEPDSATAR